MYTHLVINLSTHSPAGNCNLVYAIIRKRNVFHQLANLPSDPASIQKALQRKRKSPDVISRTSSQETVSMEGSHPAVPAEPGTLKASLVAMPGTDSVCCVDVILKVLNWVIGQLTDCGGRYLSCTQANFFAWFSVIYGFLQALTSSQRSRRCQRTAPWCLSQRQIPHTLSPQTKV